MVDVEKNINLVSYVYAKKFGRSPKKYKEDLIQEGYVALINACKGFSCDLDCNFSEYATQCIADSMDKFLQLENRFRNRCLSLDAINKDGFSLYDSIPSSDISSIQRLERKEFAAYIMKHLESRPEKIRNVVGDWFADKDILDISKNNGINLQQTHDLICREVFNIKTNYNKNNIQKSGVKIKSSKKNNATTRNRNINVHEFEM